MADNEKTRCFTYKVEMMVQVLADDEKSAREQLDSKGGYVSARQVNLMDSIILYTEVEND